MIDSKSALVDAVKTACAAYRYALPANVLSMPTSYFEGFHTGVKSAVAEVEEWAASLDFSNWQAPAKQWLEIALERSSQPVTDRKVLGVFDGYDVVFRAVARQLGITV